MTSMAATRAPSAMSTRRLQAQATVPLPVHPVGPTLSAAGVLLVQRKASCACEGGCPRCQQDNGRRPGLVINHPGDVYEQEADRITAQVMRMPEPQVQRAYAEEAGSKSQTEMPGRGRGSLQTKRVQAGDTGQTAAPAIVHEVLRSPGQPLEAATRAFMEPRFGHDFSRVRVHSGTTAEQSAQDVNADAYTVGNNIVFGTGRFAPGTYQGRRLIAHELTHVVQQSGADGIYTGQGNVKRRLATVNSTPTGEALALSTRISTSAGGMVQRQVNPKPPQASRHLTWLADTAINELDTGSPNSKILLSSVVNATKRGELQAFTLILKAKHHETFGNYFIFLFNEIQDELGSRTTVRLLQQFANAGVDLTKDLPTDTLQPLAAVAKFKSLVQQYKALLGAGKILEADKQRVSQLIEEAEMALRPLESPRRPGPQVQLAGVGVASAASTLWLTAGALAADDVTVIGVADDVAIPFVIIGAAILSGIAFFAGGPKPVIIDYGPARAKVDAALLALAAAVDAAVYGPRPIPLPPPPAPRIEPPKPKPTLEPQPKPTQTIDVVPYPPTRTDPDTEERRRRRRRRRCPAPTGLTPQDPIRIIWYKHLSFYPSPIKIAGHSYHCDAPGQRLPHGERLGVRGGRGGFWPYQGKRLQLVPVVRDPTRVRDFRAVLESYGFDLSAAGPHGPLDIDHVQDVNWGGPDAPQNMWPMDYSANRSAGSRQNLWQVVSFCDEPIAQSPRVISLLQMQLEARYFGRRYFGRWFVIDHVEL